MSEIATVGARQIDTSRGSHNMTVSNQWARRPDDEKFLSLSDLKSHLETQAFASTTSLINTRKAELVAPEPQSLADTKVLHFESDAGRHEFTHWSFGQLCSLSGAPPAYLRTLPSQIVADVVNYEMTRNPEGRVMYHTDNTIRAYTSDKYGRIFDYQIVEAIERMIQNSTPWKVPGKFDAWGHYDPHHPVTKDTTTLFASDRDIFVFLVDDLHPIEIGKLPNGDPDYLFRGFYVWNSEVGSRSFGIATMYLRGVCCNRILWGVENFSEITFRHSRFAPERFADEARPALESFSHGATRSITEGVKRAQEAVIAKDDHDALEFLRKRTGFSAKRSHAILTQHEQEEGRPIRNVWDVTQGITAFARGFTAQDERVDVERKARAILDQV